MRKLVKVFTDITAPGKQFTFPADKELQDAIILGISFVPNVLEGGAQAGKLSLMNPDGTSPYMSVTDSTFLLLNLVDDFGDKIMDDHPLYDLIGFAANGSSLFNPHVIVESRTRWQIDFTKSYIRAVQNASLGLESIILLEFTYLPKGAKYL